MINITKNRTFFESEYEEIARKIANNDNYLLLGRLKNLIKCAEISFKVTDSTYDILNLLASYDLATHFYSNIYHDTLNESDILPAISFHEKIVYLIENDLIKRKDQGEEYLKCLRNMLESIIQVLYYALKFGYMKLFASFLQKGRTYSKKLYHKTRLYVDEYYIIVVEKLNADASLNYKKYSYTYKMYKKCFNKLYKIYKTLEKEEIKMDLLDIINQELKICNEHHLDKKHIYWMMLKRKIGG